MACHTFSANISWLSLSSLWEIFPIKYEFGWPWWNILVRMARISIFFCCFPVLVNIILDRTHDLYPIIYRSLFELFLSFHFLFFWTSPWSSYDCISCLSTYYVKFSDFPEGREWKPWMDPTEASRSSSYGTLRTYSYIRRIPCKSFSWWKSLHAKTVWVNSWNKDIKNDLTLFLGCSCLSAARCAKSILLVFMFISC